MLHGLSGYILFPALFNIFFLFLHLLLDILTMPAENNNDARGLPITEGQRK